MILIAVWDEASEFHTNIEYCMVAKQWQNGRVVQAQSTQINNVKSVQVLLSNME